MDGHIPPDPGWRGSGRGLVPGGAGRGTSAAAPPNVVALRMVFVSFAVAVVLFLAVLLLVLPTDGGDAEAPAWPWALPGGLGPVALAVSLAISRRAWPCEGSDELAQAYVRRFFLQLAFGEVPALLGFVASFLVGMPWPYVLGLALTGIAFARAAPTAGRLQAIDEELVGQGCPHSLRAALYPPASQP